MLAKLGVVLVLFPFPSASRAAPPWRGRTVTEEDAFVDACPVFASTYMPMYLVVPLTVPFIHAKCFPWRRSPSPILNLTCMHSRMLMVVCWSPLAFTLYSVFALSSMYLSACHYACCSYLILRTGVTSTLMVILLILIMTKMEDQAQWRIWSTRSWSYLVWHHCAGSRRSSGSIMASQIGSCVSSTFHSA